MTDGLDPAIEPFATGMLQVGDGHHMYWESCGDPDGIPALVVHGGPGSGCTPWHRRLFDPRRYRIVLFDQRGCGRSTPVASDPAADLSSNTTQNLIADMEALRVAGGVDRWVIVGGSWGSTLEPSLRGSPPGPHACLGPMGRHDGPTGRDRLAVPRWRRAAVPSRVGSSSVPVWGRTPPWTTSWRPIRGCSRSRSGGAATRGTRMVHLGVGNARVAADREARRALRGRRICTGVRTLGHALRPPRPLPRRRDPVARRRPHRGRTGGARAGTIWTSKRPSATPGLSPVRGLERSSRW